MATLSSMTRPHATAPAQMDAAQALRPNFLFALILVYYWIIQFITPSNIFGLYPEQLYTLFVAPMAIYMVFPAIGMIISKRRLDREIWLLVTFLVIVISVSVYRTDSETILTSGYMCLVVGVIYQRRVTISASIVNILFLLSIPVGYYFYIRGWSYYSVLPSFGNISDLSWRVSVLPLISSGAFFALIVFFINLFYRHAFARAICLPVSAYFLLFSGLRTAIFATILAGAYLIARRYGWLRGNFKRIGFFTVVILFFSLSIFSSEQLAQLPILSNDFIRSLIVREDAAYSAALGDQVFTAAIRGWIIERHWYLIADNPLLGVGTFEFQELNTGYELFDNMSTGTEAYLTGLFARVGLPAVLLLLAIFVRRRPVADGRDDFARTIKLVLFLAMITYGSFIVPYDFIFLLMLVAVGNGYVDGRAGVLARPPEAEHMPARTI